MTALNKQALREAAEKATPGEWKRMMRNSDELMTTFHGVAIGNVFVELTTGKRDIFDAEFIAAANPATVLALLDELEAVQKTSAARLEAIDRTHKMFQRERDRADAAEKRIAELEARKVTVKLPADYRNSDGSINDDMFNTCAVVGAFRDALAAAGIGVKGE
ncbi:ead/Ea22-like family protein [Salmonella enterica subsp. enterica serovar Javiana]|nr:ead/Ea22-like family protein [Salmonella enterica subsp. enterica serovar Javiana]